MTPCLIWNSNWKHSFNVTLHPRIIFRISYTVFILSVVSWQRLMCLISLKLLSKICIFLLALVTRKLRNKHSDVFRQVTFSELSGNISFLCSCSLISEFLPGFLRYSWQIILCKLKVYNVIWYRYILWNDYPREVNTPIISHRYHFVFVYKKKF